MAKLAVLMVTAFVDMVGLFLILPLLPFYATRLSDEGVLAKLLQSIGLGGTGFVVAVLVSSFAVAQLLSAPLWGRISDRYGRRPALLVGLAAAAIAYVVFAFADSLDLLFLSRIVQGAGGGTVGVIQAYVADATEPKNRAKSLGWLSAATNAGVAIGPAIGAFAAKLGPAAPGLAAAALTLLNMLFAWRFLVESRVVAPAGSATRPRVKASVAVRRVVSHSGEPASRLIWIYAIAMGAFHMTTAVLALFLALRFDVDEDTIGFFFTYIGVISVVTRAGVLGWAVDRFGEVRLSRIGTVLLSLGLATIPLTYHLGPLALAVALVPLGTAFTFPCVTALLSRVIASDERGLYMGVQQSFGGMARVAAPLFGGWAYDALGPGVPFWVGAAMVLGTLALGLGMERYATS
ncbi:MAG TPA: MFS transporter [Gemmatimonadaceae bacterium]